ncbi:two component, sigma54 specific, transcriptional regulator, Fis family [Thioalkalivibrio sulfidiphilus HL-EbGr7]|uniref:Two component, sigma54 specific, transcriptional regulator, Fis family n=1 Tax=Thioalkalivibrio sulfidiphilus (strain HL-EbGR7) TaxID=396588 RepID=B8GTB8_THISH|nr:sigma-54 dependent transcriptional regulator [Thioalkalivibrio sulfidiphilus]ACL71178.1 two component, sigma54 specific, transcriptional regulator, Fis family [Thioalkalivibrio sulfidiphilus HL-EbGr7]
MNAQPVVVITEDDEVMRELVVNVLHGIDATVIPMESSQESLDFIENNEVAVVVTDLRMPRIDGMKVLDFARQKNPLTQVILMTGHATVESAVQSLKAGAFDYICKPFENVELRHTVERALSHWNLSRENMRLREENKVFAEGDVIIGRSAAMDEVHRLIDAAAAYDCSVLITGESGTGKELVARQIHLKSPRRDNSFVAINCAAIPEQIIESELFGYQKGAFTGAERAKPGLFETANGGTIFLDEVNNASLSLQAKLLRVLQDATFYRLGDTEPRHVNVRVLAATNRDVPGLIAQETFREDLYYRLRVIEIHIPALRDRRDDVPLLANYFISKYAKRFNKPVDGMSTQVLGALMRHDWPGNVRELENVIQRALILCQGKVIDEGVLPPEISRGTELSVRAIDHMQPQTLEEVEVYFIRKTLRETNGDRALCAEILGIDKSTLWRKIKRYSIEE